MNILIWGTGKIATEIIERGLNANIIGFIQSQKNIDHFNNLPVYAPEEITMEYDFIIIGNAASNEIYHTCVNLSIDMNKLIFWCPIKNRVGFTNDEIISNILGERNFTQYSYEWNKWKYTFFDRDKEEYKKLNLRKNFQVNENDLWPVIAEKYAPAGTVDNYFWQDLWAAKHICKSGLKKHIDIGSRIDGFISHLLVADIEVTMIDVRDFPDRIDNLHTIIDDATYLHNIEENSIDSISALCSLEHFGLGRYGDPINPEACFICFEQIQKKMKKGGAILFIITGWKRKTGV